MRRYGLLSSVAAVAMGGVATVPAHAQQAAATADPGEIVVTARKRSEAAINVPLSVSAISALDRQNLVLDGVGDYLRQTAGALLVSGGPDYLADISIRGQGGRAQRLFRIRNRHLSQRYLCRRRRLWRPRLHAHGPVRF